MEGGTIPLNPLDIRLLERRANSKAVEEVINTLLVLLAFCQLEHKDRLPDISQEVHIIVRPLAMPGPPHQPLGALSPPVRREVSLAQLDLALVKARDLPGVWRKGVGEMSSLVLVRMHRSICAGKKLA